jgi:excisionase family DNA binding protein
MPYKLNKIIFQRDRTWGCETYSYTLNTEIDFPYAAGMLQKLTPKEPFPTKNYKPEISDLPLFNEKGLGKLIPQVGPKGIYYLELRPGYKLEKIYAEPDELIIDIYYGGQHVIDKTSSHKSLIYSFYNPTRRVAINISCRLVKDTESIWQKIYAHPDDLYWRQLFINDAKSGNILSVQIQPPVKELMNQDQLAEYLQVTKKTIQNWTANRTIPFEKIPGTREVRYRKSDIDAHLKSADNSQRKKKK